MQYALEYIILRLHINFQKNRKKKNATEYSIIPLERLSSLNIIEKCCQVRNKTRQT